MHTYLLKGLVGTEFEVHTALQAADFSSLQVTNARYWIFHSRRTSPTVLAEPQSDSCCSQRHDFDLAL